MGHYSFLTEGMGLTNAFTELKNADFQLLAKIGSNTLKQYGTTDKHKHPFVVGDKVMVRHGIRCMDSGKKGIVIGVKPHEKYDYDVITVKLKYTPYDPVTDTYEKRYAYKVISMSDGSFEKLNADDDIPVVDKYLKKKDNR